MQNTKKIGIIVRDLSPSYLSFCLIDMINKQVEETPDYDFTIFYENRYPNSLWTCCVLQCRLARYGTLMGY